MAKFVYAYHGSPDFTPEEGQAHMQKWRAWVEGLGDAFVDPGVPVGKSVTVSADGVTNDGGSNPLSGYSVVEADDLDAAIEMARSCPHLDFGTIEIAPVFDMPMA